MRRTIIAVLACAVAAPATASAGSISVNVAGTPGENGWYVGPVTVTWTVSPGAVVDPDSACDPLVTILAADTKGKKLECRVDVGTLGEQKLTRTIGIDMTPPLAPAATPARGSDAGGWYHAPVGVGWSSSDATSGIASCASLTYAGPDDPAAHLSGTCRDRAGNSSPAAPFALQYDATPPQIISAVPERGPDRAGWYVRPVPFALQASDAVAGLAGCAPLTYAGPDDAGATAAATCTDRAGNTAVTRIALRYDATPPAFSRLTATTKPGAAILRWTASGDTTRVSVKRSPGSSAPRSFGGASGRLDDTGLTDGRRYTYAVTAVDAAGNTTTRTVKGTPPSLLRAPAPGAHVTRPPVLRWRARKGARYYNVQLYRGSRKVMTAWPRRTRLVLPRTWRHAGRRERLTRGTYRWYVWPGYGPRAQRKYGALLGRRTFVMTAR